MTLDEVFREQISRGQQPMVALNNAAQAYAEELSTKDSFTHNLIKEIPKCRTTLYARYDELEERLRSIGSRKYQLRYFEGIVRIVVQPEESAKQMDKDCSQYADETKAWDEPQENNEIEMQRRLRTFLHKANPGGCRVFSLGEQCQCPLCVLDRLLSATSKPQDSEAVELLREQCQRMKKDRDNGGCLSSSESAWFYRVMVFLEGKQ